MQTTIQHLQKKCQDFSDNVQTLTDLLNQYPIGFLNAQLLPTAKEDLDKLQQNIQHNITLTKQSIHELKLKTIDINHALANHSNAAIKNLKNQFETKMNEFNELKSKALNQIKEQQNLNDHIYQQLKKLITDSYVQDNEQINELNQKFVQQTQDELNQINQCLKQSHQFLVH